MLQRSSIGAEDARDPCMLSPPLPRYATNACAAYAAGSSAAPARRSGPAAIRRLWRWSEAASPPLLLSSRTVSMQCKSPQQSPARPPPAYIHTYGFWMDALPSAPCTAKPPLPESSSISDMDGCLGAKYIYRYGTIFFLNEEFRGGRTSFPDLTTPFVYVNK